MKNDFHGVTDINSCQIITLDRHHHENGNLSVVENGKELPFTVKRVFYVYDVPGDKQTKAALIAERGGKLIAKGTATEPIVFTSEEVAGSRKPGDWGGIILCGKAKNNQTEQQIEGGPRTKHGGADDADNSGALSYVRIEFAGYPFQKDKEINGLTLGSVGSGTEIDHVQVSYSNDDSFEWFGGTVNCKYLVAYKGWDDDFDTDNGFSGKVQYGLSLRRSVQFLIISRKWEEIGLAINKIADRGCSTLNGNGFYSKRDIKVIFCIAKKSESAMIFDIVDEIDPDAFVAQSAVIGVYGQGFDRVRVRKKISLEEIKKEIKA